MIVRGPPGVLAEPRAPVAHRWLRRCCDVEMDLRAAAEPIDEDWRVDDAWRTYGHAALRFATALVGPHDAHDITANAFLRATRHCGWSSIERFDRYLLRSVRNEAQNLYRQQRRRWERDLAALGPDSVTDAAPEVDLWRAVASLSLQQRSVVFLAYWQDLTEAEIADTLDLARSTVHRTLVRARITLRKALR
jgi:RNA polymerase sigma factor (sigma-70 family)